MESITPLQLNAKKLHPEVKELSRDISKVLSTQPFAHPQMHIFPVQPFHQLQTETKTEGLKAPQIIQMARQEAKDLHLN